MNTVLSIPSASEPYWLDFEVDEQDLDFIYNLLLEREVPLTPEEMATALVGERLDRLEREAQASEESEFKIYLPEGSYEVGEMLVFPALGNKVGRLVAMRDGENPGLGSFEVIQVEFEGDGDRKEFAARLEDHKLNRAPEPTPNEAALTVPEAVMERFGNTIQKRLEYRLQNAKDTVRIAGRWFPKALLADIHEGHLNLAEAVLDVAGGGPLPTKDLLEHVEVPGDVDPLLAEFSLDFALQEDDRFDEVGPAGQVLWYLNRLEPPEVLFPPPRLAYRKHPYDRSKLTGDLLDLEVALDDELSDLPPPSEPPEEVTVSLLFPHWRVGALPLSSRFVPLFPTAYESPRIRFLLVDGHSGDEFPGWVVRQEGYVFGLDGWFRKYQVPAGGLVKVRRGDRPGTVVVEVGDRRSRNDWIRTVSISEGGQIGFTMLKQPVGADYDDLMVVGLVDPIALDEAWLRGEQRNMPLNRLIAHVFRELAKLNPQSAVHAQSLYSGVNVIRRIPPGPVFSELVSQPYFVHVGDLYWRFDETAWRQE